MTKETDNWVNDTLSKAIWPKASPELKDRIMMGVDAPPPDFFGNLHRPMMLSVVLLAMVLGFVIGAATNTTSAAAYSTSSSSYYTGAGSMLFKIFET